MDRWIKISVNLSSHWLWEDAELLKWWLDLLLMASWEDKKRLIGRNLVTIKRGQLVASVSFLCNRWGRSRKKIAPFLQMLQDEGMIEKKEEHNISIITICNYDKYQSTTEGTAEGTHLDTHLNTDKQSVLGNDRVNKGTHLDTHIGTHVGTPNLDNIEYIEENKKVSNKLDTKKEITEEEKTFLEGMKEHYPNISKMKEPLQLGQYQKLLSLYAEERVKGILENMENSLQLTKKYISAYRTANNWIKNDIKRTH